MTTNIGRVIFPPHPDVTIDQVLENLLNVRRMAGIIDYYRTNGASSGEIALAIGEFVKRGEEGVGLED